MPRDPRGEKRLADVVGNAVLIGKIATGEVEDIKREKDPNAVARFKLTHYRFNEPGARSMG